MKKTTLAMSILALSLGLALSPLSASAVETASSATSARQTPSPAPMPEEAMPSVVSISVEGSAIVNTSRMSCNSQQPFGDDSPFCQDDSPFRSSSLCQGSGQGDQPDGGQQQKFMALGSGVITDVAKGYVMTNNHAADSTITIKVQLNDGRKFDAKVVSKDPRPNVTLIQIQDPKNPAVIKLADSDTLHVSGYTVVIGNPFGLGETVTSGIVSALGRSGLNVENYENSVQTDVVINRGNSGGALVNLSGEPIGINTTILVPGGGNIGIGFAIPNNMMKNLTEQAVKYGQVKCDELGTMGTELSSGLTKAMKVDAQRGAFINQAMPGLVATKAGTKAGDATTTLNSEATSNFAMLRVQVSTMSIGSKVELGLLCDGKPVTVTVGLQQSNRTQVDSNTIFNGIEGAEMSNKGQDEGVVVDNMRASTPAAQISLRRDDIIVRANQQPVKNIANPRKIFDARPSMLALNIQYGDAFIYLLLQ